MQNVTCPNITYMFCASFYSAPAKYVISSDSIYTDSYTPFAYKENSNHEFVPFSVNCQSRQRKHRAKYETRYRVISLSSFNRHVEISADEKCHSPTQT